MNVETLFEEALATPPRDRPGFLAAACQGRSDLLAEVETLLAAHEKPDNVLDRSPVTRALRAYPTYTTAVCDEIICDRYRLQEPIGEGGMGTVWMAEQCEPVQRMVALKLIKPGMDSARVLARFEAERQALAMMDHPNIAQVYDGGTTDNGRPFFVMELVRGIPITEYCDREKLSIEERLELFAAVCRAVQHAHQKGIIHRDLKPTNILVTVIDGEPVPKVIDFGVAKAIGDSLTDRTNYTSFHQFVGTPLYMSPEQAELAGTDIDTRSDIYSLGVLLYELLTGTTPFDSQTLKQVTFDEMRRMIREDEPPRPSQRLNSLGDTRTSVAEARRSEPKRLKSKLRGELDWIVLKAMDKDRKRRYETAGELAADIGRYLSGSPVAAAPASRSYRLCKFARRHRVLLSTVSVVGLTLVISTGVSAWLAIRAIRAERNSDAALNLAEQRLKFSERHLYASRLRDVRKALEDQQVELAQEILDDARPSAEGEDLRDFAWHYLQGQASRDIVVYPRHPSNVRPLILLAGDQRMVYGTNAGEVAIVDTATGQLVRSLQGHSVGVDHLAASADGRTLVSAGCSGSPEPTGEVRIWNMTSGSIVGRIDMPTPAMHAMWLSDSGRILTLVALTPGIGYFNFQYDIASDPAHPKLLGKYTHGDLTAPTPDGHVFRRIRDNEFVKIDIASGETREFSLPGSEGVSWCGLSPDGRIFAHIDEGQQDVVIRDAVTGAETDRLHACTLTTNLYDLWLSKGADTIAIVKTTKEIHVWDRTRGTVRTIVPEGAERTDSRMVFALSADGRFIALSTWGIPGGQTPVRVHDVRTGNVVATYPGRLDSIGVMQFTPDGRSVYLSSGHSIKRWNLFPEPPVELAGHNDEAWCLAFTPDSRYLFSGSDDTDEPRTLKVWNVADGRLVTTGHPHFATLSALAISPDGKRLATGALVERKNISLWNIGLPTDSKRWTLTYSHPGVTSLVRTMAFSPDSKTLAKSGDDRKIHLIGGTPLAVRAVLEGHTDKVRQVAFGPDGKTLASVSNDGTVRLWDMATHRQIGVLNGPRPFTTLAFSPDGTALAVGDQTGLIRFIDPTTMKQTASIHSEDSELRSVAYSPDGRILAAAGMGKTIRLWDTLTQQNLLDLKGHEAQVNALAFSPDGTTLASCDHAGRVKLWKTRQKTPK